MGFGLSSFASSLPAIGSIANSIGNYISAGKEQRYAGNAVSGLQQEQQLGRQKAQELYGNYLPAGQYGIDSLSTLNDVLNKGDMSKFYKSPNYQFTLDEGTKGVDRYLSAHGGINTSRGLRAISDYAQGTASGEFQNWINNLLGFSQQSANTGLAGGQQIMSQYGNVTPGQIAGATINLGQAKAGRAMAPYQGISDLSYTLAAQDQMNQNRAASLLPMMGGVG